ncbi:uncharacterized protein LOC128966544 [Oppia nitens]|uniref:uncharacterized protein LOC128966544 n=1 Tax=Oppia nitens TaxID=1686743 RepID=UPI0023DB3A80|nr:uncharacterized protein LOC128966544 [Oppia nitens]
MPDFGLTRQTKAFWHSNEERSQFIRDFLKAINVSTIDCLVCHSSGIQPVSMLWSDPRNLVIKSLGLFCPQPLWHQKHYLNISKFLSNFAKTETRIKFLEVLKVHKYAHKFYYPIEYPNVDQLLFVSIYASGVNPDELHQRIKYLRKEKIPTLVVFGERDKTIHKKAVKQFVDELGVVDNDYIIYSDNKTLEKDSVRKTQLVERRTVVALQ